MSTTHATSNSKIGTRPTKVPLSPKVANTSTHAQQKPANHALDSKPPYENSQKKVPRRSSKPIINWFQRKLAGSSKVKRTDTVPLRVSDFGLGRSSASTGHQMGRITSSPLPVPSAHIKQQSKLEGSSLAKRRTRTISLHGEEERGSQHLGDNISMDQSSLNRDSLCQSTVGSEADEDASVRPIPPSSPPSPSPSRDSSSYLSDPRTFRSMAASTKPTTLLSIDLNANGMAHIAQAPMNPPTPLHRFAPHVRQSSSLSGAGLMSSGNSITFSSLPSPQAGSRSNSLRHPNNLGSLAFNAHHINQTGASVQAPLHTQHHPRNNPRPSSPPMDNASVLTLASSAFGITGRSGALNYPSSALGDSISHYGGGGSVNFRDTESTSQYVPGDEERLEERDFDASVRALRPRSSRRGSWESEASRWSARMGAGTPSLARERSLFTSNSVRTGHFSAENEETYETADDDTEEYDKNESILETSPVDGCNEEFKIPPAIISEIDGLAVNNPASKESSANPQVKEVTTRTSVDTIAQPTNPLEVDAVGISPEAELEGTIKRKNC